MENDQISDATVIQIDVLDHNDLSFFYRTHDGSTATSFEGTPACTVTVSLDTYTRLLNGESTFEHEVTAGTIVISGDTHALRHIGKALRAENS